MNRKSFIANMLMSLAISILPKSLLPSSSQPEHENDSSIDEYSVLSGNTNDLVLTQVGGKWFLIGMQEGFEYSYHVPI